MRVKESSMQGEQRGLGSRAKSYLCLEPSHDLAQSLQKVKWACDRPVA
jgi:hypothetical protein